MIARGNRRGLLSSSDFFSGKPVKSRFSALFIPKMIMGLGLTFGARMG